MILTNDLCVSHVVAIASSKSVTAGDDNVGTSESSFKKVRVEIPIETKDPLSEGDLDTKLSMTTDNPALSIADDVNIILEEPFGSSPLEEKPEQ